LGLILASIIMMAISLIFRGVLGWKRKLFFRLFY
jgi:hypothetical protein